MLSKNKDLEKVKQVIREEFETLSVRGSLHDDLLVESFVGEPTPGYYEAICSFLYKTN